MVEISNKLPSTLLVQTLHKDPIAMQLFHHYMKSVQAYINPVLEDVHSKHVRDTDTLNVISNRPAIPYRNKTNCCLMSTVPFTMSFKRVTWNYCERSHSEEAPYGVCSAVKRDIARTDFNYWQSHRDVNKGLYSKTQTSVEQTEESDNETFKTTLTLSVQPVTGIINTHQVLSSFPGEIVYREVSCVGTYPKCAPFTNKQNKTKGFWKCFTD